MTKLKLQTKSYTALLLKFREWMKALNYAEYSVKTLPIHVREYLFFIEQKGITKITQIQSRHTAEFLQHLIQRPNQRTAGALSTASINKMIVALNMFFRFLRVVGKKDNDFALRKLPVDRNEPQILTLQEIKELFQATYVNKGKNHVSIGTRDRAMLAIFYGCGLRKSEGLNLNLKDIDLNKRHIYVLGKGKKERIVPISHKAVKYIEAYQYSGREWFLMTHSSVNVKSVEKTNTDKEAFFLNEKGKRLQGGIYTRLKILKERAHINKTISLHTLRHSIATHLLVAGMEIEDIARFLGHNSLESTQIYTHIAHNYEELDRLVA